MLNSKDSVDLEFEKIVSTTKWAVLTAIQKYLNEEFIDSIDDVAQEVYLRMYKFILKNGMDQLKLDSIGNWVYTISKNESLRFNSKIAKQSSRENTFYDESTENISSNQNIETMIVNQMEYEEVLNSLPKPFREVFELNLQGLSGKAISKELNIAAGTVKSRLSRARSILHEKFKI